MKLGQRCQVSEQIERKMINVNISYKMFLVIMLWLYFFIHKFKLK